MQRHGQHGGVKEHYGARDFLPLIIVFGSIIGVSILHALVEEATALRGLQLFMGWFFVVLGGLKIVRWRGFVDAYQSYDLIARRSRLYGWLYPFIELGLGTLFLSGTALILANSVTLVLMLIGAAGVLRELLRKNAIPCACIGAVFTVPMTWVTLAEDVLMAGMAAWMLTVLLY